MDKVFLVVARQGSDKPWGLFNVVESNNFAGGTRHDREAAASREAIRKAGEWSKLYVDHQFRILEGDHHRYNRCNSSSNDGFPGLV